MKRILLLLIVLSTLNLYAEEIAPQSFSLPQLDGGTFDLDSVLGKKIILINFWATWCKECVEEIPQLIALQKSVKPDDAVFLGIAIGDKKSIALKFKKRTKYPYTVLLDANRAVAKKYNVLGLPVTIVISKDGKKITYRGSLPPKKL